MIIYNKTELNNLHIQNEAEQAQASGLLTAAEHQEIKQKYPHGLYHPGIWIRIGLFILTCIIAAAAIGLLSLIFIDAHIIDSAGWIFFLSALTYASLELMVRNSSHYKSGVDDALILISAGIFLTGLSWFTFDSLNLEDSSGFILISAIMFIYCLYLTLRFADILMAAAAGISLLAFVFFSTYKIGAQIVLPFAMILSATLLYLWSEKASTKLKSWYYGNALIIVQIVALISLYLSGNYFVVRELNGTLNSNPETTTSALPFAFFFWMWTVVVPLVYIGLGLKRKNVILLRCGLLLVAAAAFTIRTYFYLMSLEALLCLIGAVLIGIAYGTIKYLKTPKYGFTHEEAINKPLIDNLQVESLIVAETFSGMDAAPIESSKFGGGSFGGGGAGGGF